MSGVFLSYARFDSELGERIVAGLRALDVECWWDRDMPGVDWPQEIERQIDSMSALVVIWTAASKDSKYVRAEAIPAFDREKLVNIMVGVKEPPLPFNLYNGFQLDGWSGREPHEGWTRLVRTLEAKLVKTGEVKQGQLVAALGRREQGVRRRQAGLAAAEDAFAAAKAADGEADAALAAAKSALARAEEQLAQVSAMRAGPNVIRGAQADLDEAHAGVKNAEAARKNAASELASASRALARAKTQVETAFVSPPELESEPAPDEASAEAEPEDAADPAPADVVVSAPPALTPVAQATPKPASEATPPAAATSQASPPTPTPAEGARPVSALAAGALASGGAASAGQAAAGAGSQPKRSSPMPLVLGAAAVLVVGVITIGLFSGRRAPTPISTSANAPANAADNSAIARAEAAPGPAPAADPLVTAAQAMVGDWSGNGAVCGTNPLSIAFDPTSKTIRETLSNTPSVGALVGKRADGSVELRFAGDGHTEYDSVSGDTLTLGFNTGPMTYQRCAT